MSIVSSLSKTFLGIKREKTTYYKPRERGDGFFFYKKDPKMKNVNVSRV